MKKRGIYIFQLRGMNETREVEADDSAEALRRCLRENGWPLEMVIYRGKKNGTKGSTLKKEIKNNRRPK